MNFSTDFPSPMMIPSQPPSDNILIWVIGILGTLVVSMGGAIAFVLKNRKEVVPLLVDAPTGMVPESRLILNVTNIVRSEIAILRTELKELHLQEMVEIKENFEETHKARNTLLVINSKLDEAERNIIEAVKNGKH